VSLLLLLLYLLAYSSAAHSLIPTDSGCGYRQPKARLGRKHVRPWKRVAFTNPAREVRSSSHVAQAGCRAGHCDSDSPSCVVVYRILLFFTGLCICLQDCVVVYRIILFTRCSCCLQDNLTLQHWRREADASKPYAYARFNKSLDIPSFSEDEYSVRPSTGSGREGKWLFLCGPDHPC